MARNRVFCFLFFLELLLFLETKNSFTCPTLWSHRYLELLNLGNEEERRKLGDGAQDWVRRKGEDRGEENRRKVIESEKDKRDREGWGGVSH